MGAWIVCRIRKLNFLNLLDLAAMSFLIGQGIGRWGNFTNQEAFGTNTNLPWGMWSSSTAAYINSASTQQFFQTHGVTGVKAGTLEEMAYVHPTFLYESLWCLLSFVVLYLVCRYARRFSGQLMLCYGVLYGAERCFVEGLRLDSLYIGASSVRVSQLLSGLLAVGCLAALVFLTLRFKKNPRPIEGVDYFPDLPGQADNGQADDPPAGESLPEPTEEVEEAEEDAEAEEMEENKEN